VWKRTPMRAAFFILPPRSTWITEPSTREPAGIASAEPTRTSLVTRASTGSSTFATSLDTVDSTRRPITESADTTILETLAAGRRLGSTRSATRLSRSARRPTQFTFRQLLVLRGRGRRDSTDTTLHIGPPRRRPGGLESCGHGSALP
jgi:hypothetical protein